MGRSHRNPIENAPPEVPKKTRCFLTCGYMLRPFTMMRSLRRPSTNRKPAASMRQRSPVRKYRFSSASAPASEAELEPLATRTSGPRFRKRHVRCASRRERRKDLAVGHARSSTAKASYVRKSRSSVRFPATCWMERFVIATCAVVTLTHQPYRD